MRLEYFGQGSVIALELVEVAHLFIILVFWEKGGKDRQDDNANDESETKFRIRWVRHFISNDIAGAGRADKGCRR